MITSLDAKRGHSERLTIRLDGAKAFDVAGVVAEEARLHVGDLLSEEAQSHLIAKDAPYRARDRALALLALRDRSRREIEVRLGMAGFTPEVVSDTCAWLLRLGYLDERRFAMGYVAEKLRGGWGPHRIRAELLRKGVERALVEETLSREGGEGEATTAGLESATTLARRRFGEQFRRDPVAAGRRLAGFLARRGYDWDLIAAVARILAAEAGGDEPGAGGDTGSETQEPSRATAATATAATATAATATAATATAVTATAATASPPVRAHTWEDEEGA
ncbi:MAG: recombination regulator RecX [Actinomycetia bacterium]|nr:recombination regulator RecX [Actinomycetes bacterium]